MISENIATAFKDASLKNRELHQSWISASQTIGELLPESLLPVSIQRAGEVDILIRTMESERNVYRSKNPSDRLLFTFHYQVMFSELWIGQLYEIVRLLKERKLLSRTDQFEQLAHQLRLVRVTLEKHEIAADRKLQAPLQMQSNTYFPNEKPRNYEYLKDDKTRSHIMPTSVSERGSLMWQVIDISKELTFWVERQNLSDTFLKDCL